MRNDENSSSANYTVRFRHSSSLSKCEHCADSFNSFRNKPILIVRNIAVFRLILYKKSDQFDCRAFLLDRWRNAATANSFRLFLIIYRFAVVWSLITDRLVVALLSLTTSAAFSVVQLFQVNLFQPVFVGRRVAVVAMVMHASRDHAQSSAVRNVTNKPTANL